MSGLEASIPLFLASLAATVASGRLFSWVARRAFGRTSPALANAVAKYGSWGIYLTGFLFSLSVSTNLRLEVLLLFFGALAAATLLGLKDVLPNIAALLILEALRPFRVGDWVEIDGMVGRVVDVDGLYTVILTADRKRVYVPNSLLLKREIANLTRSGGVEVAASFEVPAGGDIASYLAALKKALESELRGELSEGEPRVELSDLSGGRARVTVRVRIWNPSRAPDVRTKILLEAAKVLSGGK